MRMYGAGADRRGRCGISPGHEQEQGKGDYGGGGGDGVHGGVHVGVHSHVGGVSDKSD